MGSSKYVFPPTENPVKDSVVFTFDEEYSSFLVANFFLLDDNKGIIVDQNNNHISVDLTGLKVDWDMICACFDVGIHCVDHIKGFYPNQNVKFLTARSFTNDGSVKYDDEPEFVLYFGLN